jgi:S1-C subfamily serine protease
MLKKIFAFGAALIILAVSNVAMAKDDSVILPEGPFNPVVHFVTDDGEGYCTGFFVSQKYIVTAGHCFAGVDIQKTKLKMTFDNGTPVRGSFMVAVVSDPDSGLADFTVLKFSGPKDQSVTPVKLNCGSPPAIGTKINMKGWPQGVGYAEVEGIVSGTPAPKPPIWYRPQVIANMTSLPGNSGSPVYVDGEVFGILVGSFTKAAFAIVTPVADTICMIKGLGD